MSRRVILRSEGKERWEDIYSLIYLFYSINNLLFTTILTTRLGRRLNYAVIMA